MRILYPVTWSRPDRKACREQTANTAAALARRGHAVSLLLPRGENDPDLNAADLRAWFGVDGDFRIVQRPSRWAGESLAANLMWLRQTFRDPEVAAADMLFSRMPAMLAMGQLSPLPFVTDHYRPWPDDLPAIRPLIRRTARHPACLGLILHSGYAADAYRRAGVDAKRILVAHNGAAAALAGPVGKAEARARLGLAPDRPIAAYAGRINARKGLDQLLALAGLRPQVLFLLVGSESEGPIERQAAGLDNVRVVAWQEPAVLPLWLQAADVLLIPPSRAPLQRFRNCVLPLKTFAYLAAGRPILAPASPDTAELLVHGECAWLVAPERSEEAASGLDRLLGDVALAKRLGAEARRLSQDLTWDRRAERIEAFLELRLNAVQRSPYRRTVKPISATMTGAAQAPTAAGK